MCSMDQAPVVQKVDDTIAQLVSLTLIRWPMDSAIQLEALRKNNTHKKWNIWFANKNYQFAVFRFLVDSKINSNRKQCPLSIPVVASTHQNNQFTEAISVTYNFVCELPDATCQTTGRCVQSPAWNETPGSGEYKTRCFIQVCFDSTKWWLDI